MRSEPGKRDDNANRLAGGALAAVCVAVIAKFPSPGRVKTRLTPAISPEAAADVHRCFLLHFVDRLARLAAAEIVVYFDPPEARDAMRDLLAPSTVTLVPQIGGDLGYRLANLATITAKHHRRTLILAVDSPDVPRQHIVDCARAAADAQVVLGLADDGGYWCIGLRSDVEPRALLHSGIAWSSARTAADTLANAEKLGYSTWSGAAWDDVDRPEDLMRVLHRLAASEDPDDRALLKSLGAVIPEMTQTIL